MIVLFTIVVLFATIVLLNAWLKRRWHMNTSDVRVWITKGRSDCDSLVMIFSESDSHHAQDWYQENWDVLDVEVTGQHYDSCRIADQAADRLLKQVAQKQYKRVVFDATAVGGRVALDTLVNIGSSKRAGAYYGLPSVTLILENAPFAFDSIRSRRQRMLARLPWSQPLFAIPVNWVARRRRPTGLPPSAFFSQLRSLRRIVPTSEEIGPILRRPLKDQCVIMYDGDMFVDQESALTDWIELLRRQTREIQTVSSALDAHRLL